MNRPGVPLTLQLDESNDFANDSLKDFDTTFRAATGFGEEISVSGDRMRMNCETFGDSGLHAQLRIGKKLGVNLFDLFFSHSFFLLYIS